MSLLDFAVICELEDCVEAIFYHKRRDWERRHLRWRQDLEEFRRAGHGRAYSEPGFPSIRAIRKQVYSRV